MASSMLTCSSTPLVLSNKASSRPSAQFGLGTRSVVFRSSTSIKTPSLVVKAQGEEGLSKDVSNVDPIIKRNELNRVDPLLPLHLNKSVAMIDTSPYMRTPWKTTEDENDIQMWFDVPGLAAPEIDVRVVDNNVIIKGPESVDGFGMKIYSPFDCKLQLRINCAMEKTQASLKNGVLNITVPKITKAEHMKSFRVPVKPM